MAKITKEQAMKWDSQLSDGFFFDWKYYVIWGEKVARHNIDLGDGKILQATLEYHEIVEKYRRTGQVQPTLHLQIWRPTNTGCFCSGGLGKSIPVGQIQNKKLWNELCKLSVEYDDDEKLLSLMAEHMDALKNDRIA